MTTSPVVVAPKVLAWGAENMDTNTIEQASRSALLPFIVGNIALMPDAHYGYGATVGSVIATQGAVIPAAIGVDIGCGMIAAHTDLTSASFPDDLGRLHGLIRESVPAGMGQGHDGPRDVDAFAEIGTPRRDGADWWTQSLKARARNQFGSLGGGNHFVEVCLDEADHVWVVLHSGSRGVGKQLAEVHIDRAKGLMKRYFIDVPDPDLAYLVSDTPEFDSYISDMLWAQDYAYGNRSLMMDAVLAALRSFLARDILVTERINCHHNYTEQEHHQNRNVWLTRKGAIRARYDDRGVIPGSMGTSSFIVRGLGNEASFQSCSHGAGRRMSRSQARKTVTGADLTEAMKGVAWNDRDADALVDEAPAAYKDINAVMAAQADLVEITHTLRQILNYKGVDQSNRKHR